MMSYKNIFKKRIFKALLSCILCILIFAAAFIINDFDLNIGFKQKFDTSQDFVRVIDVGQGDSILIYSNGYSALIDTGLEENAANVCSQLSKCNIKKIDVLLLTHLDYDHVGGVKTIFDKFKVEKLILPELSVEAEGICEADFAINKVSSYGGEIFTAVQGMNFSLGEFEITILGNFSDMSSENNRSIVSAAEISDLKFLFTGDIESAAEKRLLNENLDLKCDVLKVAHHGSSTSTGDNFLKATKPDFAVISVGADNIYSHPHNEILSALEHIGTKIYRTDNDGHITFSVVNGKIIAKTEH